MKVEAEANRGGESEEEIDRGERFAFGDNWAAYLDLVDENRIEVAVDSIREMLDVDRLDGCRFLDAGSGSGLFSVAARRLGACVVSFDYDAASVACARELRHRYYPRDADWRVGQGSVLDAAFMNTLGKFDVVYSWGVLHHTGAMWDAIDQITGVVATQGRLFISIYNDQGRSSRTWKRVKRAYNGAGPSRRRVILDGARTYFRSRQICGDAVRLAWQTTHRLPQTPAAPTTRARGMDRERDLVDWVGGWPFEVARPEEVFDFVRRRGFELVRLKTCQGGPGCNEFVFRNRSADAGGSE